ncbi:hypothetical protein LguiB_025420 [Lonicera macranthoides]
MGEYKFRYLRSFLEQKNTITDRAVGSKPESYTVRHVMKEIKKMENEARKCYAELIGLESDEFVEMMLLDACFVIEFVRKCCERGHGIALPEWDYRQLAQLFNRLGNGVGYSSVNSYYSGIYRGLNQHRNKLWNRVMARLWHNYLYSPWAVASTIAAVMLLLLTITQTIAAVLSLSKCFFTH